MEAILKLLVGLDGATAEMVLQLGWVYLASRFLNALGLFAGFGVVGYVILRGQRAYFEYDMNLKLLRDKRRDGKA